jgi:hypothetical protein
MAIIRKALRFVLFAWAAISIFGIASTAAAQPAWQNFNPCETGFAPSAASPDAGTKLATNQSGLMISPDPTHGLEPVDWGLVVYDSNQGLCWLVDATLAGTPEIRAPRLSITCRSTSTISNTRIAM